MVVTLSRGRRAELKDRTKINRIGALSNLGRDNCGRDDQRANGVMFVIYVVGIFGQDLTVTEWQA